MRLNRFWLMFFAFVFVCGAMNIAPATAASKDKDKPKSTKVAVKSPKKPKTVRVTVTRSNAPVVAGPPSLATALGLRGQRDELNLKSSVDDCYGDSRCQITDG
jgi:serine-type D-Ala-D-Ala endopeptidase (penicillin-binding protein 7)